MGEHGKMGNKCTVGTHVVPVVNLPLRQIKQLTSDKNRLSVYSTNWVRRAAYSNGCIIQLENILQLIIYCFVD